METYTPDSTKIVHETKTDFIRRTINKPIHIVQYDNGLPIIAVSLYLDGQPYIVPSSADVNIRVGKSDRTSVYNEVLGCNANRTIVYFEVTLQMTAVKGIIKPVLEVCIGDNIANSGWIEIEIDLNPVQEGDIESSVEYKAVQYYASKAETEFATVEQAVTDAASSASDSALLASSSASSASESASTASSSASDAASSAAEALASKTSAASSASDAASSASSIGTSASDAASSASSASESASAAASSASNAASSAAEASTSKTSAASSASDAASSASSASESASTASASASNAASSAAEALTSKTSAASSASDAASSASSASENASSINEVAEAMAGLISYQNRRNTYRGKNLGTSITSDQISEIQAGTFNDLFVGDYWTINNVNYRIADIDYWYNCGDTNFTQHHLVIVPDTGLYSTTMNSTNTTAGGYVGSLMHTTNIAAARTTIETIFGDNLLTHREYLVNAVASGKPSASAWFDSDIELMNEIMVYGTTILTPANDGSTVPTLHTVDNTQLALFRLNPTMIKIRASYWLRDVVSSYAFAAVTGSGFSYYYLASISHGVRPAFAIG